MLPIVKENKKAAAKPRSQQKVKRHSPDFSISSNKVYFISLGCPRNRVDTEVMVGILLQAGYEVAETLQEADFIVINTCGFLEASRQESVDTIRAAIKDKKPNCRVIATGCMVQTHSDVIRKECPEVHYLLGSGDVTSILQAVEATGQGAAITDARSYLEVGEVPRTVTTSKNYAYLKIAEGCRKRCAFCIIPTIKGPLKSKSKEQVIKEFGILLNQGIHEIILIAQDLGDYGKDMGFKKSDGLVDLLQSILSTYKEKYWLRLLYLYPDEISDGLIDLMAQDTRILPYIDMPIQHASNRILKAMHRKTSKEEVVATIEKLREKIPHIVIRTSFIVGFPGEIEQDFNELVDFVRKYTLDNVGIFIYSLEDGSHAATLPDHIPDKIKQERHRTLSLIQQKICEERQKKLIGQTLEVVIEGYHPDSNLLLIGRYYGQCPEIDGCVIINDPSKVRAFGVRYPVAITEVIGYDLVGHVT